MSTLAERVCHTLEGITLLEGSETEFGDMVYRFCHIASERCGNPHEDWVEEFERVEKEIEDACASPADKAKKRKENENKTRVREQ